MERSDRVLVDPESEQYRFTAWGLRGGPRPRGAKVETWVRHFLAEASTAGGAAGLEAGAVNEKTTGVVFSVTRGHGQCSGKRPGHESMSAAEWGLGLEARLSKLEIGIAALEREITP